MAIKESPPIRVLIADDYRVIRTGVRAMLQLSTEAKFEVEEAPTTEDAIQMIMDRHFDIILMDYKLPGRGGPKAIELILRKKPGLPILAISFYDQRSAVDQMMQAGARGYILKDIDSDTLVYAIRTVLAGKVFYSNEIALKLINDPALRLPPSKDLLTSRERQILQLIVRGLKDKEIAEELNLAKKTVDNHRDRIRRKLKVRNTAELVQAGMKIGVVE